jgi:hypothetical protein
LALVGVLVCGWPLKWPDINIVGVHSGAAKTLLARHGWRWFKDGPSKDDGTRPLLDYKEGKRMVSDKIYLGRWRPWSHRTSYPYAHHGDSRSFGAFLVYLDNRLMKDITQDQWQTGFIRLYHVRQVGLVTEWQLKPQLFENGDDAVFEG